MDRGKKQPPCTQVYLQSVSVNTILFLMRCQSPDPFPENTYISKERPIKPDEDLRRLVLRHYNLDSYEVNKAVFTSVSRDFEESNMMRIFTLTARYWHYFFLFHRVHQMHALFLCC